MKRKEASLRKLFHKSQSFSNSTFKTEKERLVLFKERAIKTRKMRDILKFSDAVINFVNNCGGIKLVCKPTWKKNNMDLWNQLQSVIFTWILLMKNQQLDSGNKSWSLIFYDYMYEGNTIKWDSFTYKSIPKYYELLYNTMDYLPPELYIHAEELCAYFKKHSFDPYGCTLSQKPTKKILEKCLQGSEESFVSNLPFLSTDVVNKSSRKETKQSKYHLLLSKIIQWSTLKPSSLVLAVKKTASIIRGVNNLISGDLVLVNINDEWVYARVAVEPSYEKSSILVYLTPDESQISTVGKDNVLPIPLSILRKYFYVEDCCQLENCVEDTLDNIHETITNICRKQALQYLEDNGINSEVCELTLKGQNILKHEEQLILMNELLSNPIPEDNLLQVKTLLSEKISENIKNLQEASKFTVFPFKAKSNIEKLQNFNYDEVYLQEFKKLKDANRSGLVDVALIKKDILSGKTKKSIVDGWHAKIKSRVYEFLSQYGFKRDALPREYIDEVPNDISIVKSNEVILHRIIESYRIGIDHFKLQELIDYLCSSTYKIVDLFIEDIVICVASYLEISIENISTSNDELLSLLESSIIDNSIKKRLIGAIRDKKYLEDMKQMEEDTDFAKSQKMVIVPISGLVVSLLCRLENEHLTSLSIWEKGLIEKQKDSSDASPLEKAIIDSNLTIVKDILSSGNTYVNETDGCGLTPLHIGCSYMNSKPRLEITDYLLDYAETNIGAKNNSGNTALHFYTRIIPDDNIQSRYRDVLLKFIRKAPKIINVQNLLGETPLHLALLVSNIASVKLLLENDADPNIPSKSGNTPVHYSVNIGNIDCVELLLKYNGNHTIKNALTETPIDIAFKLKNINILQLLIATETRFDNTEDTQGKNRLTLIPMSPSNEPLNMLTKKLSTDMLEIVPRNKPASTLPTQDINMYFNAKKEEKTKITNDNTDNIDNTDIGNIDKPKNTYIKTRAEKLKQSRWVSPQNPRSKPKGNFTTNKQRCSSFGNND